MASRPTLYTFTLSHFSEKVRWAFDFEGIDYEERRLLPGLHVPVIRRRAPKATVPVLETDGGVIQGSGAILDYLQDQLGGSRLAVSADTALRAAKLEAVVDHAFGLGIQRIFYEILLADRPTMIDLWAQDAPSWTRLFYRAAFPLIAREIRRSYVVTPQAVAEAKQTFRATFEDLDRMLERRRYLLGDDAPSRVDIAVAALLAPLCEPPEHIMRWPKRSAAALALAREFEGRPTWDFVLRMYRDHRKCAG
jgi:glutathione S-transferase